MFCPFFLHAWSFTILVDKETSAERYTANAPSMLLRAAFSVVALLDSSECLQELKPFLLAFGTPGGSEIMSSVDAFMRDVAPVDCISVKSDFKGFYYGADLYRIAHSGPCRVKNV